MKGFSCCVNCRERTHSRRRARNHRCSPGRLARMYAECVLMKPGAFRAGRHRMPEAWAKLWREFPTSRGAVAKAIETAFLAGFTERDVVEKLGLFCPVRPLVNYTEEYAKTLA